MAVEEVVIEALFAQDLLHSALDILGGLLFADKEVVFAAEFDNGEVECFRAYGDGEGVEFVAFPLDVDFLK